MSAHHRRILGEMSKFSFALRGDSQVSSGDTAESWSVEKFGLRSETDPDLKHVRGDVRNSRTFRRENIPWFSGGASNKSLTSPSSWKEFNSSKVASDDGLSIEQ